MDTLKKYQEIAAKLGLDVGRDEEAAKLLDSLMPKDHSVEKDLELLDELIRYKNVFVFGAGPSLKNDLHELRRHRINQSEDNIFIAADGAAKALFEEGIYPYIQVSDLDGFPEITKRLNHGGVVTVIHAHGDNMEEIRSVVPNLIDVIPTTQTKPFNHLHNFGGFTDGDRSVFLASHFNPEKIILAGMDFGKNIGFYAGKYNQNKKIIKLEIAKRLLEEYARETKTTILNMTSMGESIQNIPRINIEDLINLIN